MGLFIFSIVCVIIGFVAMIATEEKKFLFGGFVAGFILFLMSMMTIVPAGHVGVQKTFGKVSQSPLYSGLNFVNPLSSIDHIDVTTKLGKNTYQAETSDTQTISVEFQINYHPEYDKVPFLYEKFGTDFSTRIIGPAISESVMAEISRHKVIDIVGERPNISDSVKRKVKEWLAKYHLNLTEMALTNIDFSDQYDKAIEAKQVEEQKAAAKLYELKGVQTEAEKVAAEAKGRADAQRAMATAEADSLKIRGEAQAEYNQRVAGSLNPLLIERMKLEKWDGKLPVYMFGNGVPLISIEKDK